MLYLVAMFLGIPCGELRCHSSFPEVLRLVKAAFRLRWDEAESREEVRGLAPKFRVANIRQTGRLR